ncbi:MAG TPA: hypothetical protein VNZ52_02675 [Candidatus Thermoplasmatota archaeon]|nr:hypothetical protein [Candidatus Thermoplasmatota archaeon]
MASNEQNKGKQDKTPEQIREEARNKVGKPIAAATGTVEGMTQKADPSLAREIGQKAGEAVRQTNEQVRPEVEQMKPEGGVKQTVQNKAQTFQQQGRDQIQQVGQKAKENFRTAMQAETPEEVRARAREQGAQAMTKTNETVRTAADRLDPNTIGTTAGEVARGVRENVTQAKDKVKQTGQGSTSTTSREDQ